MAHIWANVIDVICWVLVVPALAYVGYRSYHRTDDRRALVRRWIISAALMLVIIFLRSVNSPVSNLMTVIPIVVIGLLWVPSIATSLLRPLTGELDGGDEEAAAKPFYYTAEGKRRHGLYEEAIAEVRKQLEKFPGDYEGWIKLATIQMEDMKNLSAAETTLSEFIGQPGHQPNEYVSALHLLADWQLQFGRDAVAAKKSLQRIIELYPGTPFSHAADQRMARFDSTEKTMRAREEKTFTVTPGERDIGLRKESIPVETPADPHEQAVQFVRQLEQYPTDTETRERLAVLYAEEFKRVDLAADQLEQLIGLPAEPPKHVVRWLNLLATLQIKHAHDMGAAEKALHRIIERFPGGASAAVATRRLATLQSELKAGDSTSVKHLGAYEKDLGLKQSHVK